MNKRTSGLFFLASTLVFSLAGDAFALTALKQVQVSNGSQVDLLFDGKVGRNQIKTEYFNDIIEAKKYIDSSLFRPPYGRISPFQSKYLRRQPLHFKIIMWDVLSKDYDTTLSPDDAAFNVLRYASEGSIVVFHDSEKAYPRMQKALVATLQYFSEKGCSSS